jgi:hypothetical protein
MQKQRLNYLELSKYSVAFLGDEINFIGVHKVCNYKKS